MKLKDYNNILEKYVEKYGKKFKDFKDEYKSKLDVLTIDEVRNCFFQYKIEVKNFLCELIDEFDEIKKYKFTVLLNGSFSRNTNTLFSDVDINYFYDNKFFDEMIQYEYKMNYIIKEVMNFRGMDRIHSMVVYLPLISSKKYDFFSSNKYPLVFEDGILYYSCRENAEQLMFEMYNSTRNIDDVVEYLNEHDNPDNLYEWSNCFELVYDNGLYDEFLKNRKVCKSSKNILNYISKCIDLFNNENHYFGENTTVALVADLKKYYKGYVINNVYFMFAIIFRLHKNLKAINLNEFIDAKIFDNDFCDLFYTYINCVQKLQVLLDQNDMDLSSHSSMTVDFERLNSLYYELSGKNNIISEFNIFKRKLYEKCINYLEGMKEDLYDE